MISYCQLSIRENQITFPGSVYKVMTLFNMRNLQLCNWFNEKICYDCINIVLHPVITNTNSQQRRNTVPQVHPPVGCILPLQESNKGRGSIVSISSCCPSNAKFITRLHKITENSMMYIYNCYCQLSIRGNQITFLGSVFTLSTQLIKPNHLIM